MKTAKTGEMETSTMLANRPDLVHMERAGSESGKDMTRLAGNKELGELSLNLKVGLLAEMIRSIKKDAVSLELQKKFLEASGKPLETKPEK